MQRPKSSKFHIVVHVARRRSGAASEKFQAQACVGSPGNKSAKARVRAGRSPRCGVSDGATLKHAVRGAVRGLVEKL